MSSVSAGVEFGLHETEYEPVALVTDIHAVVEEILTSSTRGMVVRGRLYGTSPEGGEVEFVVHLVTLTRVGRIERMQLFGEEAAGAACSRFAEVSNRA